MGEQLIFSAGYYAKRFTYFISFEAQHGDL